MMKIKKATAVYSGGGIYLYYAELENGNYLMGSDDGLLIVNTNPLANEEVFEESNYYEWQEEHLVKFINDDDFQKVLNQVLDVIFNGKTIKEYDNFSLSELKERYE